MALSLAEQVADLEPREQLEALRGYGPDIKTALAYDWKFWGRPEQQPPPGSWSTWLILTGRGWGKTRTGAEWVRQQARNPKARIAMIAPTAADVRDVMVEGNSGVLSIHPEYERPAYEPSKRRLTWPNGAVATTFSADEPDRLRGPQFTAGWFDELAAWRYPETYDMAMFGMRLGDKPKVVITTTPRPIPILRQLIARGDGSVILTRGSTYDNRTNLSGSFLHQINERYGQTRLGRQEIAGEILGDLPGALWTRDMVEDARVAVAPDMERVVVGVDPSGKDADSEGGDEQGIIVAGLGVDGLGYVLADASCRELPGEWGRRVIGAYQGWNADRIVAETNFGGGMVRHTIQTAMKNAPVRVMTASRGKVARAEPVSALFEQGRVKLVGTFPQLEDQMCSMKPSGYEGGGSPDRLDAMVWAMSDLMLGGFEPDIIAPVQVGGGPAGFAFPMPG